MSPQVHRDIRAKLEAGTLPRTVQTAPRVGRGHGVPCAGCDLAIQPNQIEWAFAIRGRRTLRFHLLCAGFWEAERRKHGWIENSPPSVP